MVARPVTYFDDMTYPNVPDGPDPWIASVVREIRTTGRAVDLGAGQGRHSRWLRDRGWQVTAIDREATEIAGVDVVRADLNDWTPPTNIDLAVAAYVYQPAVFQQVAKNLAPGATFVITTHHDGDTDRAAVLRNTVGEILQVESEECAPATEVGPNPWNGNPDTVIRMVCRKPMT
jgi:trans-aconitate methyltransferase